ncbi:MAG: AI-2E family transporter [Patescibacteria group bacterium]
MDSRKIDISTSTIFRVVLIGLVLVFLYYIIDILLLVFISFVIVSAVSPIVDRLEKYKIPRFLSTILIYALGFFGVGYLLSLAIPLLIGQTKQLLGHVPQYWNQIAMNSWIGSLFGLDSGMGSSSEKLRQLFSGSFSGVFFTKAGSYLIRFIYFAVVFSLSFYMTIQKNALKRFIEAIVPEDYEKYIISLVGRIQGKLGHWLQGQLFLNLIIGGLVYLALYLLGIPFALVLALAAAFLEFIPTIGPVVAAVLAALVALTISPVKAILAIVVFVIIQQLENHLIVPIVMKQAVGLNPVVIIIALLIGAKLAGPLGAVLAVPVTTALSVFVGDLLEYRKPMARAASRIKSDKSG